MIDSRNQSVSRQRIMRVMRTPVVLGALVAGAALGGPSALRAQSVCLPAPRLLTTKPMGGTVGSQVEITLSGEHLDDADQLLFSDLRLTATRKLDGAGQPVPNQYVVTISSECPPGLYEARVTTRLGLSSSRVFSVGTLPEVTQTTANTSLASAIELKLNTVCNAVMSPRAADHYVFEAHAGQRVVVDCASRGIDSKLDAVLVVADAAGRDLKVERRGGILDFRAPADGRYVVKVHELTYQGGSPFFYRLTLRDLPPDAPIVRHPSTQAVNSFSWPPPGLAATAATAEVEPNADPGTAQKIALPCDIAGNFFPAADVDVYEFEAKKGEVWWVEIASERLGRPTDPAAVVQRVTRVGDAETLTDIAEFNDIPSPVKVSSNGYAYDGPPYDAGSSDFLGKLEIPEDGLYRLQLSDLYGGTRNDPNNVYRLVIRKAQPDFAIVAWPQHMELRNGDRAALSKPISLRGGATMALEVVAIRRDGFDGEIDIVMEGLPEGVTAQGLKIPAGKSRGMLLVTARADAPRVVAAASIAGRATINGEVASRPCRMATVAWPIPDSWSDIPSPRLLADVPVSVGGVDLAPITIAPASRDVQEVVAGQKLTIPLVQTRRSEFSGAAMQLKAIGAGFEAMPPFEVPLSADDSQAVIDAAALKLPAGDYRVAFQGYAVAKYRHQPEKVELAQIALQKVEQELAALESEAQKAPADSKLQEGVAAKRQAVTAAQEKVKQATAAAQPQDIVDIIVTEPIAIRVKPAEAK